jgi:putative hydrolase of the HAD superfamily
VLYVIWDFDGTLGYRQGMWSGTLVEILRHAMPECPATVDDIRPHLRAGFPWHHPDRLHTPPKTAEAWWASLLPVFERAFHHGARLPADDARRLAQHVRAAYLNPERWHLFDDALQCLRALTASGWRHVILSNHVPELPDLVRALGLASYMEQVFSSAQTGVEKPHPQAFRNVLTALGGTTQIWMVGDSMQADIAGAQAVGLPAVLVRGHHPHAAYCCETLAELPSVLSRTELSRAGDGK